MTWIPVKNAEGVRRYPVCDHNIDENRARCAAFVNGSHQCRRARGHGPGGEFCRQHAAWVQRRTLREVGE